LNFLDQGVAKLISPAALVFPDKSKSSLSGWKGNLPAVVLASKRHNMNHPATSTPPNGQVTLVLFFPAAAIR
jgi:hypothetical protein